MERSKLLMYRGRRHLPIPTGPYTVGCIDIMTSYSKYGVFSRLYYPSNDQGILDRYLQWPLWLPHKEYLKGYAVRKSIPPWCCKFLYKIMVGNLYIPAVWHGPLKPAEERYPVIVFSHGLSGWRTCYSSICLELASHGFVVAALEHRDHSASASFYKKQVKMSSSGNNPGSCLHDLDELFDNPKEFDFQNILEGRWKLEDQNIGPYCLAKEWMLYQPPSPDNENAFRNRQVIHRAKECAEVLDMLESLNLGRGVTNILDSNFDSSMFKNQLNLKNTFIIGHSFGGATALQSLATELRFKAGILLDPYMVPFQQDQSSFALLSQPFLCLSVKTFQTEMSIRLLKQLQKLCRNGEFVELKDAYHRDLCDTPFVPKFRPAFSSKLGWRIDRFEALDIESDLILSYLGQQMGKSFYSDCKKLDLLKQKYLVFEENICQTIT